MTLRDQSDIERTSEEEAFEAFAARYLDPREDDANVTRRAVAIHAWTAARGFMQARAEKAEEERDEARAWADDTENRLYEAGWNAGFSRGKSEARSALASMREDLERIADAKPGMAREESCSWPVWREWAEILQQRARDALASPEDSDQ